MKPMKLKGWFTVTDIQIGPITASNQLTNERITMKLMYWAQPVQENHRWYELTEYQWVVGCDGDSEVAVFTGSEAKNRALEYAAFKNMMYYGGK